MKIKKNDLTKLIREMTIDEMAWKNIPGNDEKYIQKYSSPSNDQERVKKLFTNKKFQRNAKLFFSSNRAFPNSDVYIVPYIGLRRGEDIREIDQIFESNIEYETERLTIYDLDEEIMREMLSLSDEDISNIDKDNDIIFYAGQPYLRKGDDTTFHMMIHALFEGITDGSEYYYNEDGRDFFPKTFDAVTMISDIVDPDERGIVTFDKNNSSYNGLKTNATRLLRKNISELATSDIICEILTSAFLRYKDTFYVVLDKNENFSDQIIEDEEMTYDLNQILSLFQSELHQKLRGKLLKLSIVVDF